MKYSRRTPYSLDDRDRQVLALVIEGVPHKEIARRRGTTSDNVSLRLSRIRARFDADTTEQLVAILFRRGELK